MYNPEKERQFNALSLPERARIVTIDDALAQLENNPQAVIPNERHLTAVPTLAQEAAVPAPAGENGNVFAFADHQNRDEVIEAQLRNVYAAHDRMGA